MPSFGELLRRRRLAAGLTQEALAERARRERAALAPPDITEAIMEGEARDE